MSRFNKLSHVLWHCQYHFLTLWVRLYFMRGVLVVSRQVELIHWP